MSKLIIIGAGPGGYETALLAAKNGLDVTLIEREAVGGTCLNVGCIPTKALCRSAEIVDNIKSAAEFGITTNSATIDFPAVMARKDTIIAQLKAGIESLLSSAKIHVVRGKAKFIDKNTVEVAGEKYSADNIIIATGSVSASLPIEGADLPGVVNSSELLNSTELPKRLCIIGAGVIGLEFASIFHSFGCEVSVIEYAKEVLPHFDSDVAKRLRQSLGKREINIETQAAVTSIKSEDGELVVCNTRKGKEFSVVADKILMAVGRKPNIESLNLADVGIDFNNKGITVDENMQTNIPGIYAIGDINGKMMLAHAASFQGIKALNHITKTADNINLSIMPAAVFTRPELATVGLTEEECKETGMDFTCRKTLFRANGKALCLGETDGLCKLLVAADGKILGCHILGPHASDLIHEISTAMTAGLTVNELKSAIHTHPTLSEVLQAAF